MFSRGKLAYKYSWRGHPAGQWSWARFLRDRSTSQLESSPLKFCTGESSNKNPNYSPVNFLVILIFFSCLVLSDKLVQPSPSHFEYLFWHMKKHATDSLQVSLAWVWLRVGVVHAYAYQNQVTPENWLQLNCRCNLFCGREVYTWIFLSLEVKSDPHPRTCCVWSIAKKTLLKRHSCWNMSQTILAPSSDRLQMGSWNADLPVTHRSGSIWGAHVAT